MKHHIISALALIGAFLTAAPLWAQNTWTPGMWGNSDPSEQYECGQYQWPLKPSACPEAQIKQKHDHTPLKQYQAQGWDTVVDCNHERLELSCMPYIPVQYFNGQYYVDTIPYDPPDPTFSQGTKMPVSTDDDFASVATAIPFSFFFFGIEKNAFVLGANGLITFDVTAAGHYCPWKIDPTATLPWPNSKTTAPSGLDCTKANMRDAIYGIYEDTHPIASYLHGDQGIYYGWQGERPCRKIIASWNGIPTFPGSRNQDNRCTYQIVCYEGSNIIEVHVKRRGVNTAWQGGRGVLAVQNATGQGQERGDAGTPTRHVKQNAPAVYYPAGGNPLTTPLDSIAFRFTPAGVTPSTPYEWYRILDTYHDDTLADGTTVRVNDTVRLRNVIANPEAQNDPNGYYYPMGQGLPNTLTCPNLTRAWVHPDTVARYGFHIRFKNAANEFIDVGDTIVIGLNKSTELTLRPKEGTAADHEMAVCAGDDAHLRLEYPELQDTTGTQYTLKRISGGDTTALPDSLLIVGERFMNEQSRQWRTPLILKTDRSIAAAQPGKVDSILVHFNVDYLSGCTGRADLLVRALPSYDSIVDTGICAGETFHWDVDNHDYRTATTSPMVRLQTVEGSCDSVMHLHLTVSDTSRVTFPVFACKAYTWDTAIGGNGRTYYESNLATSNRDTVVRPNEWGCDSVTQLEFTMIPMTPIIDASLDYFDFNNLSVTLTDVSVGGISRIWLFPNGDPQTDSVTTYTAPYNIDSAEIKLVESSPYGCVDTAVLVIPFRRDVIWAPNVFTPDIPDRGNDKFHSVSTHLIKEQTLIYNRFGELIFHCEEVDCAWDGTYSDGTPCPQGSYIYVIHYTTQYDPHTTHTLRGTVTLLR